MSKFHNQYMWQDFFHKEVHLDLCDKWRREWRFNAGFSYISEKPKECKNVNEALNILESKLNGIILPFIEPINEIIRNYLLITDVIEDGMNTPQYKLLADFQQIIRFDCMLSLNHCSNSFRPAIVLIPANKGNDHFELEMTHNFEKYRVLELVSSCYVNMSVYCCEKLETSIDSNFTGLIIDVTDPYKRVFVKFGTKSKQITLVLECLSKGNSF